MIEIRELLPVRSDLSLEEIDARAMEFYRNHLQSQADTLENEGKLLTIDVDSGDYEIGTDYILTVFAVKRRHPNASTFTLRIGYPALYSHGFRMKPLRLTGSR